MYRWFDVCTNYFFLDLHMSKSMGSDMVQAYTYSLYNSNCIVLYDTLIFHVNIYRMH
jgi:hypothetical protein